MTIKIGSNIAALNALRRLGEADDVFSKSVERLSSGMRINRASDDAASLAISESLKSDARVMAQGVRNANDGVSMLNIADDAMSSLIEIIERQKELAIQAATGSLSMEQRTLLDSEASALTSEYERIVESTEFNGIKILEQREGVFQLGGESLRLDILGSETQEGTLVGLGTYSTVTSATLNLPSTDLQENAYYVGDVNGDGIDDVFFVQIGAKTNGNSITAAARSFMSADNGYDEQEVSGTIETPPDAVASLGELEFQYDDSQNMIIISTPYTDRSLGDQIAGGAVRTDGDGNVTSVVEDDESLTGPFNSTVAAETVADLNGDGIADRVTLVGNTITLQTQDTTLSSEPQTVTNSLPTLSISLSSQNNAQTAVDSLSEALQEISQLRGGVGASLNRLEVARGALESRRLETEAANSRILAADIAEETANLVSAQIRKQAAALVLSQINLQPSIALELLLP